MLRDLGECLAAANRVLLRLRRASARNLQLLADANRIGGDVVRRLQFRQAHLVALRDNRQAIATLHPVGAGHGNDAVRFLPGYQRSLGRRVIEIIHHTLGDATRELLLERGGV